MEECFKSLEKVMSSTPVLATLDFTKPFVVECDALGVGNWNRCNINARRPLDRV